MKKSLGAKTLVHTAPVWLVGSYDSDNVPNLMTASWGGICCSRPPCLNVCLREATASYHNIIHHKAFTVSVPSVDQLAETDYCGIASGKDTDKFAACGFTAKKAEYVNAPYANEMMLVAECRLKETVPLGLHTMFVGEVLDIKAEEAILNAGDKPDITLLKPFSFDPGSQQYYGGQKILDKAFTTGRKIG